MQNYTLEEFRSNLEEVVRNAVIADEVATVQIGKDLKAVVISEAGWNIMRDGFSMLIGGQLIGGRE